MSDLVPFGAVSPELDPVPGYYRVLVTFRGEALDAGGFLVDFATLKTLCEGVLAELDHQYLNDLPAFAGRNPTAEALAHYLFTQMRVAARELPAVVPSTATTPRSIPSSSSIGRAAHFARSILPKGGRLRP